MMYLQTLLKRDDNEITKKVYEAQKKNTVKGDWVDMVRTDFTNIEMELNEEAIKHESKQQYKLRLNKQNKNYMLQELKKKQNNRKKIKDFC